MATIMPIISVTVLVDMAFDLGTRIKQQFLCHIAGYLISNQTLKVEIRGLRLSVRN